MSFTPASWRTFSRRWISWARASTWVLLYLVSSRSSRISGGGTKEGRTIPWAATSANHSASERSVLRPGTFFTCCGVAEPQLFEEAFEGVVDRPPVDPRRLHGDRVDPGIDEKRVSSARPSWVVANRALATSMLPSGAVTLVQATTLSRWTSRPPTLSLICFIFTSWIVGGHRERTTV